MCAAPAVPNAAARGRYCTRRSAGSFLRGSGWARTSTSRGASGAAAQDPGPTVRYRYQRCGLLRVHSQHKDSKISAHLMSCHSWERGQRRTSFRLRQGSKWLLTSLSSLVFLLYLYLVVDGHLPCPAWQDPGVDLREHSCIFDSQTNLAKEIEQILAMITSSFQASVAVCALVILHVSALDTFIAAVYEHAVLRPKATETPVSRDDALLLMNRNIDILEKAIQRAAEQGAQIIVTPEDALYGWKFTRETIFPYLEDIPDPRVAWIPCQDPHRFGDTPIQTRLSCLAKNNSIYVLANIGDKKPCNSHDSTCPPNGYYQYNTNVVYDAKGQLVARYHKYHLYSEPQFDVPEKPELVTFDTTFGRFGMFTCFDILFHDPAVTLVKDFHVDTILFPTAWMNVLPLLTAIEFHSAWAMTMRVNLLAANIHHVQQNMTGSGIYAPDSPRVYHYDMKTDSGKLLLSELYSHPRTSPDYPAAVDWSAYATTIKPFPVQKNTFSGFMSRDAFNFTELFENAGNLTVCHKDLCCHLSYRMLRKEENEVYVLGAFTGLHGRRRREYWQVCTMLKCKTTNVATCGQPVETALTRFDVFSLSGTFRTEYVFPEVLLTEVHLSPGKFEVLKDGRLVNKNGLSGPILTVSLFGRWYTKDLPSISGGIRNLETTNLLIATFLMLIVLQIL